MEPCTDYEQYEMLDDDVYNISELCDEYEYEKNMFTVKDSDTFVKINHDNDIASIEPITTFDYPDLSVLQRRVEKLEDLVEIQCASGNWNYDPYMMGMANGMILALAILQDKDPKFKTAPKTWLKDKKVPDIKLWSEESDSTDTNSRVEQYDPITRWFD